MEERLSHFGIVELSLGLAPEIVTSWLVELVVVIAVVASVVAVVAHNDASIDLSANPSPLPDRDLHICFQN